MKKLIMIILIPVLFALHIVNAEPSITFSSDSESNGANTGARNWTFFNVSTNISNPRGLNVFLLEINISGKPVNVTIGGNVTRAIYDFHNQSAGKIDNHFIDRSPYQKNGTCRGADSTCPVGNQSKNWDNNYGNIAEGFNADSSTGVAVSDSDALDIGGSQTIEFWIYRIGTAISYDGVDHFLSGGSSSDDWSFNTRGSPTDLGCQFFLSGGSQPTADAPNALLSSTWLHVACVLDYASGTIKIYENGTEVSSIAATSPRKSASATNEPLQVGYSKNYGNYFDGLIDNVRIYDGALYNQLNTSRFMSFGYDYKTNSYKINATNLPNGTYSYKICGNTTVDGSNMACTAARTVNIGAIDAVIDTTPPSITYFNLTNEAGCENWNTDKTNPCSTSSVTPTVQFNTNENAWCAIAASSSITSLDKNYTDMGSARNCTGAASGEGSTTHFCTLTNQDELVYDAPYLFISCKDSFGNQNLTSTSGPLKVSITGLEAAGRNSIGIGIQNALSGGYTNYTDLQIYARNLNNEQVRGTFDQAAKKGSKMWAFNRIGVSESYVSMFNLTPVLYTLEIANMSSSRITAQVELLINATK